MNRRRSVSAYTASADRFVAQPLVVLLAVVASGILLDRYLDWSLTFWASLAASLLLGWYLAWRRGWQRGSVVLLLLAAAAVGGAKHHSHWNLFSSDDLGRVAKHRSRPACVEAIAITGPRRIPPPPPDVFSAIPAQERTQVTLQITRVRDGQQWRAASGRASLLVDGVLDGFAAGDRLQVLALIRRPAEPRNPGEFDFASFRRAQRELFELNSRWPDCVTVVEPATGWSGRRWLHGIRRFCHDQLERYVQEPQSDLAAAVLLGARDELSRDRAEDFFLTGTIHLLAISGLHIGILACGLWWLLRLLAVERRWSLIIAAVFVVSYAVLTESRPPVTRAAILVVAFCLARLSGRRGSVYNTLAAAALFLLCWNPAVMFQVGPQLSFLAVATIACFGPLLAGAGDEDPLRRLIAESRPWPWRAAGTVLGRLGQLCFVTTLIWLVALPLVMHRFQLVSPIALVLNPVIWLPMSVALFAGFGVLIFGGILPPVAAFCGSVCNASLSVLEQTVRWAKHLEAGYFWTPPPATWWVIGFYAILAVIAATPGRRFPRRWRMAVIVLWLAVGCRIGFPGGEAAPRLAATFVAVGHGACTIIELPDGRTLVCDAGGMGVPTSVVRAISSCLWSRGITHLDAVVLSHGDADHYNALPGLLERFSVGAVYVSPVMFDGASGALGALRELLDERGIPVRELRAGDRLAGGEGVDIEVWHPAVFGVPRSDNANSLVLSVTYGDAEILLPADIESPGLEDLLAEEPRVWHVVTAPHHGGGLPQQTAFADWARPEWVVFSGANPSNVWQAEEVYLERGARVLHTARDGAVRVQIEPGEIKVARWRGDWQTQ
jgi:competence protein ComEC